MQNSQLSPIAAKVIDNVSKSLGNSPTGVSFVSIRNYTNSAGEVSNQLVNVGIKTSTAKAKDAEVLKSLDVSTINCDIDIELLNEAKEALIKSATNPDKARSEGQLNAYTQIAEGVKVHNQTGELYLYAFGVKKEILVKGEYKVPTRVQRLTPAKNAIRKHLKGQLRMEMFKVFKFASTTSIGSNGEQMVIS